MLEHVRRGGAPVRSTVVTTDSRSSQGHQLTLTMHVDENGGVWSGVGVCLACQPDAEVRRTFTHGDPCPRCQGESTLEWRRTPQYDHLAHQLRSPAP